MPAISDDDAGAESAMAALGRRVQTLRHAHKLTLVALAGRTGLSQPFLSQIERGRARPSMESLHRIARALDTTTPALLAGPSAADTPVEVDDDRVSLVRADQGGLLAHPNGRARSLVSGERDMYPVLFLVEEREFEDYFEHDQPEFVFVLSGRVEIDLDGRGVSELREADTLYFEGGVRHRWRLRGSWPAQLLVVQSGSRSHTIDVS